MAWNAHSKQFVACLVLLFHPLHGLLKKWSNVLPPGWVALPYLVDFLIAAAAVFVIYRYASPPRKTAFWFIPFIVVALAFVTYLRW